MRSKHNEIHIAKICFYDYMDEIPLHSIYWVRRNEQKMGMRTGQMYLYLQLTLYLVSMLYECGGCLNQDEKVMKKVLYLQSLPGIC